MKILITILLATCFSGCGPEDIFACSTDRKSVELARSLTHQQLADLHREIFDLRNPDLIGDYRRKPPSVPTPASMAYLGEIEVNPHSHTPSISLPGCLEDNISLVFYDEVGSRPRVVVSWYDTLNPTATSRVLWQAEG
jgi:hypothetical protein